VLRKNPHSHRNHVKIAIMLTMLGGISPSILMMQTAEYRFLKNHREAIAAFDFLTVPTLSFRTLYCFFAIEHSRRRILHFNVTLHPTTTWIMQQLREAFPLPCPYRYVLFDRDSKFGNEVLQFLNSSDLKPMRTSIRSPCQNGVAERWVGECAS